jgi:response regulator of citrate/malate metabolism
LRARLAGLEAAAERDKRAHLDQVDSVRQELEQWRTKCTRLQSTADKLQVQVDSAVSVQMEADKRNDVQAKEFDRLR